MHSIVNLFRISRKPGVICSSSGGVSMTARLYTVFDYWYTERWYMYNSEIWTSGFNEIKLYIRYNIRKAMKIEQKKV